MSTASLANDFLDLANRFVENALSETVGWYEDVLLASGETVTVRRTETRGPDAFFRPGRGGTLSSTIVVNFPRLGKIEYDHKGRDYPLLLDKVDGRIWVAFPVLGEKNCALYGYPAQSIVLKEYIKGSWQRAPFSEVPKNLKINLAQHSSMWFRGHDASGERIPERHITIKDKRIPDSAQWVKHDMSIEEAAAFLRKQRDSCSTLQCLARGEARAFYTDSDDPCGPKNQKLEEARLANTDAESHARTIMANIESVTSSPEVITAADFRKIKGDWVYGVGSLNENCKGIIDRIEQAHKFGGQPAGYQLVLANSSADARKIQIETQGYISMEVVCGKKTIYVVKRTGRDKLVVHRFNDNGELIDAIRVVLPETTRITPSSGSGRIWAVVPVEKDKLSISLADYTYRQSANLGGVVNQKITYNIDLPESDTSAQ